MKTYQTPGVYVEEVSTLPPSVAEVETAIPAFMGFTEKGEPNVPVRITSLVEYKQHFGEAQVESNILVNVDKNGALIDATIDPDTKSKNVMFYAMTLYFGNGGGPCYIVPTGGYADSVKNNGTVAATLENYTDALAAIEKEDEPTLLVFPDAPYLLNSANYYVLMTTGLQQCTRLKDRFIIIDVLDNGGDLGKSIDAFRGSADGSSAGVATSDIAAGKYGAAYYPNLNTIIPYRIDVTTGFKVTGEKLELKPAEKKPTPPKKTDPAPADGAAPVVVQEDGKPVLSSIKSNSLQNQIKQKLSNLGVVLTPCAAVAGVYAGVDSTRGVWKAPANVSLNYVKSTTVKVTDDDQNGMNIDVETGKSVNAIRVFKGKGNIIWGARTLSGNDNEWRYINVRRFFNMVEESVKRSTGWAVFEPNDINTWTKVRAMIENYLYVKWKDGALMGVKPEDAYFVRVGLGQTMSPQDVLEGRMIVDIGMAAVRPAEFIVLTFSHLLPKS